MQITHEIAGILIAIVGALLIVLAVPIPRQVQRWHVNGIESVEAPMLTWLSRAIGISLFILGLVTLANPV